MVHHNRTPVMNPASISYYFSKGSYLAPILIFCLMWNAGCGLVDSNKKTDKPDCPIASWGFPEPETCYTYRDRFPSWSPNGNRIAYLSVDELRLGLYVYDLTDDSEQLVIQGANNMGSQAWSPDGQWLVFSMGAQIWKIRPDGSDLTRLTVEDDRSYFDPAWSPDGQWIAYHDRTPIANEDINKPDDVLQRGVWVLHTGGSQSRWLRRFALSQIWSPDQDILITRDRLESPGTWVYEFIKIDIQDGSEMGVILKDAQRLNTNPNYSPTGTHIIFQSRNRTDGSLDIWRINASGGGLKRLTSNGGAHPAWSPDGSTVAYVNIHYFEGNGDIWLMSSDGKNRRTMRR